MRLAALTVCFATFLVHGVASAVDAGSVQECDERRCDVEVTVSVRTVNGKDECTPKVPETINVRRQDKAKKVTITWTLTRSDLLAGYRFSVDGDGRGRGIKFLDGDPPGYEHEGPAGPPFSGRKSYKWTLKPPADAEDKKSRAYEVNVYRRRDDLECKAVDPVVVNME